MIVVGGVTQADAVDEETLVARVNELRAEGLTPRDIARTLVAEAGVPRNRAYRLAQGTEPDAAAAERDDPAEEL